MCDQMVEDYRIRLVRSIGRELSLLAVLEPFALARTPTEVLPYDWSNAKVTFELFMRTIKDDTISATPQPYETAN